MYRINKNDKDMVDNAESNTGSDNNDEPEKTQHRIEAGEMMLYTNPKKNSCSKRWGKPS